MSLKESTKEKIVTGLWSVMIGGLAIVGTSMWKEASKPFADYVVPAIGSTTLLWLSLLLFLLCIGLGSWCCYTVFGDKAARARKKYLHLIDRGFWIHRNDKTKVCGKCLLQGIESPLSRFGYPDTRSGKVENRWECGARGCDGSYWYDCQNDKLPGDE